MGKFTHLSLEVRYALRERSVLAALAIACLVACFAVVTATQEVSEQRSAINAILLENEADQQHVLPLQADVGSAAYYVHHVTYQPPSALAFSALGTREDLPWQHRLRMLAIEGQIYEADTGNPELSRLGRLDFAFLASVLLPLVLILLLYDLDARERRDGRYELLSATSNSPNTLLVRASARTLLLFAATILPFAAMALFAQAPLTLSLVVVLVVGLHLLFWLVVCRGVTSRFHQGPTAATALLACWLLFTTALPATARIVVESLVPVPAGAELLLAQREKVNDAWDLPKEATMDPFVASHPQWKDGVAMKESFEWKWYYAFHQVGDESVKAVSDALRDGITRRDQLMGWVSIFSPPLATQRWLSHLAETDRHHHQKYVGCARDFHASLREFHYPMLFGDKEYSLAAMADLPRFQPCID